MLKYRYFCVIIIYYVVKHNAKRESFCPHFVYFIHLIRRQHHQDVVRFSYDGIEIIIIVSFPRIILMAHRGRLKCYLLSFIINNCNVLCYKKKPSIVGGRGNSKVLCLSTVKKEDIITHTHTYKSMRKD